jgi:hypothetical protein
MKVAVIGKGTSSIITTLVFLKQGYDVDIFYDPDSPHLNVGESTTPILQELLYDVLGLSIANLIKDEVVSYKMGIKFINWGIGKDFKHYFDGNGVAFHFESSIFNPYVHNILQSKGITYFPEKISEYFYDSNFVYLNGKPYDFVISCSGWNKNSEDYYDPQFKTVNTAILYTENEINDPLYTLHRATKHGWQFGLPFPEKNITKCGYLFNRDIDRVEDVIKEIDKKDSKIIEWNPLYAKRMLQNKFLAFNGNNLVFSEPIQALSLQLYARFAFKMCDYLNNRTKTSFEEINREYFFEMSSYFFSLSWHYKHGSTFDSNFWNITQKNANEFFYGRITDDFLRYSYFHDKELGSRLFNIGFFNAHDYELIETGMTGKMIINKEESFYF